MKKVVIRRENWSLSEPRHSAASIGRAVLFAVVSVILLALGFFVRYAEDNQLFSSNAVSLCVFAMSGVFAYWSLLALVIIFLRYLKNRRR